MVIENWPIALVSGAIAVGIYFALRVVMDTRTWWKSLIAAAFSADAGFLVFKIVAANV